MPADGCKGHDERFVRLEEENKYLRQQQEEVNQALQRLADAITKLTQESAKREADKEILAQIFKQLEADRAEFTRLWARHDELVEKLNQAEIRRLAADKEAEIKRLEDDRKDGRDTLREVLKFGLALGAGILIEIIRTHIG